MWRCNSQSESPWETLPKTFSTALSFPLYLSSFWDSLGAHYVHERCISSLPCPALGPSSPRKKLFAYTYHLWDSNPLHFTITNKSAGLILPGVICSPIMLPRCGRPEARALMVCPWSGPRCPRRRQGRVPWLPWQPRSTLLGPPEWSRGTGSREAQRESSSAFPCIEISSCWPLPLACFGK